MGENFLTIDQKQRLDFHHQFWIEKNESKSIWQNKKKETRMEKINDGIDAERKAILLKPQHNVQFPSIFLVFFCIFFLFWCCMNFYFSLHVQNWMILLILFFIFIHVFRWEKNQTSVYWKILTLIIILSAFYCVKNNVQKRQWIFI